MKVPLQALLASLYAGPARAAFGQGGESDYLANFDAIQSATYSVVKDSPESLPAGLLAVCGEKGTVASSGEVVVQPNATGFVDSAGVSSQCGDNSVCVIPLGATFLFDQSIDLGALVVRGAVEWNDLTQTAGSGYLCAGYVAVEGNGSWEMDLQEKDAFIYIKDNGFAHGHLRSRAFGSHAMLPSDYPIIDINGRELTRTWSVLAKSLEPGEVKVTLMHDANLMGWRVGDRIGIAPTESLAAGIGEDFTITAIDSKGVVTLDSPVLYSHDATFVPPAEGQQHPALMSAEVVNLSRNIVFTGDDFKHVPCDPNLPESVPNEQTSTEGCRCASFRTQCTIGLHTAAMHGGTAKIQNTRVERCGQRGVEGKYCLHFHKLHDCPTCLFKNNALEGSHQRGIIVHGTHSSTVEGNVLYDVRGAGIYIEDGNEMYNDIKYNAVLCPNPFGDATLHGCTVPGTSNALADTSDNQSGIFSRAVTNSLVGNRVANARNGMFFQAAGRGRGESSGQVCESDAKLARVEGNTWHGNSRFGTYTLGSNYAKNTDQSILNDGHNIDQTLCNGFDSQGYERGAPGSMVDNLDYGNAFVGHYGAGDIQHNGHHSYSSLNLLYWKETKNFGNGCSAHLVGGSYANGNVALPDQGSFIIEDTAFGEGAHLEANHHCNVGVTGVLCMPQYVLHNVHWKNTASGKWVNFQSMNFQGHTANQVHGGIFALSPPNAQVIMDGGSLPNNFFPPGFVSLVSNQFTYLLSLPGEPCVLSTGNRYDGGILCRVPLRSLKVYSQGQVSGSAPAMQFEVWYNRTESGPADSSQAIGFHQIGGDGATAKQGYSVPVIPGAEHHYRLSLLDGTGDIPSTWVVEFSDHVIGNRWAVEYIHLSLNGYQCGSSGLVSSHHDRRFIWSGDNFMDAQAWGNTGACAANALTDAPLVDCSSINGGILPAAECPALCTNACNETTSYCDCGSGTCKLKPGFTDTLDLGAAARCGEHGYPTAKYLGSSLPVTSKACICEDGWSGPLCQFNPCLSVSCGAHGTCVAAAEDEAQCKCDQGYSGTSCEISCDGVCPGAYPFGCNPSLGPDIVRYGCSSSGACSYLKEGEVYGGNYCTFKEKAAEDSGCLCGSENDCRLTVTCNPDGSCPAPQFLADGTPCNSVPFGECLSGACLVPGTTSAPSMSPTKSPSRQPTTAAPSSFPTRSPTGQPVKATPAPSTSPTAKPTPPTSVPVANYLNPNDSSAPSGTYFSFDETEWEALFGPICGPGPCETQSITCGIHGTCVAVSETKAKCQCDADWSGDMCETTCAGYCLGGGGVYPYGCNPSLNGIIEYGCLPGGGCNYLSEGQQYPYGGFCTFKEVVSEWQCLSGSFAVNQWRGGAIIWTGTVVVWPATAQNGAFGRRDPAAGFAFQDGDAITPLSTSNGPTKNPTSPLTEAPSTAPTKEPTNNPTAAPSQNPTKFPSAQPTAAPSSSPSKSPSAGPTAAPSKSPTSSPTESPINPTNNPSASPSKSPTDSPSRSLSNVPTQSPTSDPTSTPTKLAKDGWCSDNTGRCNASDLSECTCNARRKLIKGKEVPGSNKTAQRKLAKKTQPPVTPPPTLKPTSEPTNSPSRSPTLKPTSSPTGPAQCTCFMTAFPTSSPTTKPTKEPTSPPTVAQTPQPTEPVAQCTCGSFTSKPDCNSCGGGGICQWSNPNNVCNAKK